jgi:hypothetical protein
MNPTSMIGAALAVVAIGMSGSVLAQTPATQGASPSTAAASSPAHAASKPTRKVVRRRAPYPAPGVAGATGGSPEASSRTPGGPPPGLKTGITVPIPSIGDSNKK